MFLCGPKSIFPCFSEIVLHTPVAPCGLEWASKRVSKKRWTFKLWVTNWFNGFSRWVVWARAIQSRLWWNDVVPGMQNEEFQDFTVDCRLDYMLPYGNIFGGLSKTGCFFLCFFSVRTCVQMEGKHDCCGESTTQDLTWRTRSSIEWSQWLEVPANGRNDPLVNLALWCKLSQR